MNFYFWTYIAIALLYTISLRVIDKEGIPNFGNLGKPLTALAFGAAWPLLLIAIVIELIAGGIRKALL